MRETIARPNERLDEPFVTAGTVTGDKGIKTCARPKANELVRFAEAQPSLSNQAQDEYQRLMNTNASKRAQCHAYMNIAECEH